MTTAEHSDGIVVGTFVRIGIKLRFEHPIPAGQPNIVDISNHLFRVGYGFNRVEAELQKIGVKMGRRINWMYQIKNV